MQQQVVLNRAMTAPFIVLSLWIGLAYTFGDPIRTQGKSFTAAKAIAPLDVWGLMFLLVAGFLTLAWIIDQREILAVVLFAAGTVYLWWAFLFLQSALQDDRASVVGPGTYLFIAAVHYVMFSRIWLHYR